MLVFYDTEKKEHVVTAYSSDVHLYTIDTTDDIFSAKIWSTVEEARKFHETHGREPLVLKQIKVVVSDVRVTPSDYFRGAVQFVIRRDTGRLKAGDVVEHHPKPNDGPNKWCFKRSFASRSFAWVESNNLIPVQSGVLVTEHGVEPRDNLLEDEE